MKLFLAVVVALALGTGASLFYEWTLYRARMERMQPGHPAPPAYDVTAQAIARDAKKADFPIPRTIPRANPE